MCQSSHGTQITQKNVSYDDNVNKDKPGNGYTTMSSVKHVLFILELVGILHQASSSSNAKWKTDTFLYRHSFTPVMARNVKKKIFIL